MNYLFIASWELRRITSGSCFVHVFTNCKHVELLNRDTICEPNTFTYSFHDVVKVHKCMPKLITELLSTGLICNINFDAIGMRKLNHC